MEQKTDITIICPAYNEEAIIEKSLKIIHNYLETNISPKYSWKVLIVNDGSKDKTGELAEKYANENKNFQIIHHFANMNLGMAIKTGIANSNSEYIIVYDMDLSYAPEHIGNLIEAIISKQADIVIASPYMKGGKTTDIPFGRKIMSRWVNRYLTFTSRKKIQTFTSMVRIYRSSFLKKMSLKASTFEINTEILFKAQILRARILEIPAHLDWTFQNSFKTKRFSGIRIKAGIFDGMVSGFIFRPYMFFITPGIILLAISIYVISWIMINTYHLYPCIPIDQHFFDDRFSKAVAILFQKRPHAFFVGGFTLVVALQFLGIGFLSLQNKRYFDEMFYLGTKQLDEINQAKND